VQAERWGIMALVIRILLENIAEGHAHEKKSAAAVPHPGTSATSA
jgi:hypothetical protein